jgi:phenylpropionate dioxygenase-like ring-hydroxylating dioxygenase large terminal subunit
MSEVTRALVQMDDAPANQPAREGDLGFLWDFWYPALRSTEIVGQRLATAMLLEIPLVLGRTSDGKAFAMRDSCPHRGIPLSYGRVDGHAREIT